MQTDDIVQDNSNLMHNYRQESSNLNSENKVKKINLQSYIHNLKSPLRKANVNGTKKGCRSHFPQRYFERKIYSLFARHQAIKYSDHR